ncbi:hypothetical protein KDU71_02440 [Carboxylicivirga sediminis]|uniref:Uncharacterized protein n=1 Tax=Carboxylicivirga sediminis TaxID=2006564 RepID=A0A941IW35_9BACT|nr:hypothetical protein [Carboxylicivirga sediminis]MBR8534403.1 hypothetical protein [Carboxylicivirga sediminis]
MSNKIKEQFDKICEESELFEVPGLFSHIYTTAAKLAKLTNPMNPNTDAVASNIIHYLDAEPAILEASEPEEETNEEQE